MSVKMKPKNFVDLTGQTFGLLTAKKRLNNAEKDRPMWECDCVCGKTVVFEQRALTYKRAYSCGCIEYDPSYLVGAYFYDLIVIKYLGKEKRKYLYECRCKCGNSIICSKTDIVTRKIKSCGCVTYKKTERVDLTGMTFGRLYVIKEDGKDKHGKKMCLCRCECGTVKRILATLLRRGIIKSCGCLTIEKTSARRKKHGKSNKTKLYGVWKGMRQRCKNKKHLQYCDYGGRGISICEEWDCDFGLFERWAHLSGYSEGLTLDRIDTNGNYEPNNCRWVTRKVQNSNKRNHVYVNYNNQKRKLVELCEELNFDYNLAKRRRLNGWPDELLFKPSGFKYKKAMKKNSSLYEQQEANAS